MPTYLFAWNPARWEWDDLDNQIARVTREGRADDRWSSGNTKDLPKGSRFFLIRLGLEPKGIVGSGVTLSTPTFGPHWDEARAKKGEEAPYCDIRFDFLSKEPLVGWHELVEPPFSSFRWGIQSSGIRVPERVSDELERLWEKRTAGNFTFLPDEIDVSVEYPEGAKRLITVNAYERNPQARAACIAHYGPRCQVCDVVLGERFGEIAAGFIHVHHLVPVSAIGKSYKVDPIKDMVPVCPTCHAVLHLRAPPLSVKEARARLRRGKSE